MEYTKSEVHIWHHGRCLVGTVYKPDLEQPVPMVVFSHGYNGSGADFAYSSEYLAKKGISSLCLDFCGGSGKSRSQGKTTEMTIFSEVEDLCAALEEAREWKWVRKDAMFLFGGSQGGFVSALTAEAYPDMVCGLILLFPAFCIPDNWNKRFSSSNEIPNTMEFWGMELGKSFFESLLGYNVFDHIGSYKGNVLILHGNQDTVVDLSYSRKAASLYPHAQLEIFPGEGHGFTEKGTRKATRMVCGFIKNINDLLP